MKLAVISSAQINISDNLINLIQEIVLRLSKIPQIKIITGGCLGVPGLIVQKAKQLGINTVAYSPDKDGNKHNKRSDNLALHYFNEIKHFSGLTARSLAMIKDADCILMLNGRIGTLSEFTIALEEGKKVGVITDTGGISDHVQYILEVAKKEFPNQAFFSSKPKEVIDWLIKQSQ